MSKTVTFGEAMLRLQPPSRKKFTQAESFEAYYGGCEANVAVALAQWGEHAVYVTRLPKNGIGEACRNAFRKWGVDTAQITFGGERLGIYFTERGGSQRPAGILYDRAGSAFAESTAADYDFDRILDGADWFHFSGITPALGGNLAEITRKAVGTAKSRHIRVSCDLNFRSKLWSAKQACEVMSGLIRNIDVLIINENQAKEVFGIAAPAAQETAKKIAETFGIRYVALTKRRTISGEVNEFSAGVYTDSQLCESRTYSIFLIDKVGGGDAFSAGLIYSILNKKTPQETVDFAAAAACYKHSVEGDTIACGLEDIDWLLHSDGRGRFIR